MAGLEKNCLQQTESASHLLKKQEKIRQSPDTGPESSLSIYCSPKPNLKSFHWKGRCEEAGFMKSEFKQCRAALCKKLGSD